MSISLSVTSDRSTTRRRLASLRRAAKADLLDIGRVIEEHSLPESDGNELDRFDELVRYEELEENLDALRRMMEGYPADDPDDEYDVLLAARYAVVKQQLLIVEEANGYIVQVDDLYVLANYTERITALQEHLASLAKDLKSYIEEWVGATA